MPRFREGTATVGCNWDFLGSTTGNIGGKGIVYQISWGCVCCVDTGGLAASTF